MIDLIKVGNKIQQLRIQSKLNQDQLADKLFVTRQALSRWENGLSIPSIDTLLELSKIFNVSFEEILCLDEKIVLDDNNVFHGHSRDFIVNGISNGTININLINVFYQFSPIERMTILKAIKLKKIDYDLNELQPILTISEKKFIGGNEICN